MADVKWREWNTFPGNSGDLISRSALIMAFCECPDYSASMFKKTRRQIVSAPAVDAVEVVRCCECEKEQLCKYTQYLGENGFCSNGERKENETD